MESETKKEDVDLKKQVKILRAAIKEERKKLSQLTEESKTLIEKLTRANEQVIQLV